MAFESIRLSTLGRDISVGNFYNYFTEDIVKNDIQVPKKSVRIQPTTGVARNFFFRQPDKFRGCMLGINSHFDLNIEHGHLEKSDLWSAEFLESSSSSKMDVAEVIVIFRVFKRTETLDQGFIESKMSEYQLNSRGRATHLVEEVVYGTEIICSMWRQIDKSRETKESAEGSIYLVAKDYFDQAIGPNSINCEIPSELEKMSCKILSSHDIGHNLEGSFSLASGWLKNIINIATDSNFEKWRPTEIVLRLIPDQVQVRILSERKRDVAIQKERNEAMLIWIEKESRAISNLPSFPINIRVPRLYKSLCQFVDLLEPLREEIEKLYQMLDIKQHSPEKFLSEIQTIYELLIDMTEWLIFRRREIDVISSILKGTSLNILDLEEIETLSRGSQECAKVFVLQFSDDPDTLVERIQKFVKKPEPVAKLPVFQIASARKKRIEEVRGKLIQFADEAQLNQSDQSNRETTYYIQLVPISSSMNDGTITEVGNNSLQSSPIDQEDHKPPGQLTNELPLFDAKLPPDELKQLIEKSMIDENQPLSRNEHAEAQEDPLKQENNEVVNKDCVIEIDKPVTDDLPTDSGRTEGIPKSQQLIDLSDTVGEKNLIDLEHVDSDIQGSNIVDVTLIHQSNLLIETELQKKADEESPESAIVQTIADSIGEPSKIREISNDTCNIMSSSDNIKRDPVQTEPLPKEEDTPSIPTQDNEKETDGNERKEVTDESQLNGDQCPPGLKLAQFFAQEGNKYSQLIKRGQPNVFLLNALEKSHDVDFQTIDIGRPNNVPSLYGMRNHKVIILMGATGCGKSTLINGMVNYIFGVKWDDPFRFKCVREDESTVRNQALSQTSSVTAYTIHHREGMNVPYSITIIDTPGYGDTRGVARDKEITKMIHRFLTKSPINEINAACFVACSGNSRLTATQGYILDSVLSIFGKDFKDNIRLLVTFADNADPPVVEACSGAHFPGTSPSGGIAYSKFNSSVLYASNVQQDDDFSFDQLFWEMGQENFQKFFTMLEGMNGKNLASTREVIHRRQLLERSLKDIERELEECLDKIEKIENFQRKLREYGHKMDINKNFEIEETETRPSKVNCDEGFVAYNCLKCKRTCDGPFKKNFNKPKKTRCNTPLCSCPVSEHDFQQFELRPKRVTTKKTLLDMKAEYNLNCDGKVSTKQLIEQLSEDLNMAKAKVLSLLDQVGDSVRSLESTALRSNTLSPADYLSLMRSRVAEEQKPGYLIRLETLAELQRSLAPPVQGTLHQSSSYSGGGIGHSRVSSATTTRSDETGGGGSWSPGRCNLTFD